MLQTSGVPGSVRRTRLGSVTAGRSFSHTAGNGSRSPTVLPADFDIFPEPSRAITRRDGVSAA